MSRSSLFAVALVVAAGPALAQQSPQSPAAPSRPMPGFMAMDTDNDGTVTREEFMAGHAGQWQRSAAADQNKDGVISRDEFMQAGQQRREARFKQLDRNNDGKLSQDEVQTHTAGMFQTMDRNNDGRLTPDEMRPRHGRGMGPGMMQQQGQMPMGPGWGQR